MDEAELPNSIANPGQAKPMIRMVNRMLQKRLPRLFHSRRGVEARSTVKIGHRKQKQQPKVKYY